MPDTNERLAVLETNHENMKDDMNTLFKFQREHMIKEDARWAEIHTHITKQKTVIGTVVFIISALWATAIGLFKMFPNGHH